MFAKYDLDGDRVLDEDEQRNMQADLEGQKVNIAETCFILNSETEISCSFMKSDN